MTAEPLPTEIRYDRQDRCLAITFDDGQQFRFSAEFLRVLSPSAEVRGHTPAERVLQTGKQSVGIREIRPVGNYAVQIVFDDGHDTGLYSWRLLLDYGQTQDALWSGYLAELAAAGLSRYTKSE